MLTLLLAAAALAPQGPGTSTAPVVINEFSYDDGGTDNQEFIELYNRTGAPVDISGWSVLNADNIGSTYGAGTGADLSYVIPPGTILAPGAFWVLGPALGVNNVNQVITGPVVTAPNNNLLENDNESLELRDANGVIVDSVCYEIGLGRFGPHPIEGDGFFGDLAVGDGLIGPVSSIQRLIDGYDNNDNGRDFVCCRASTPGLSNNLNSVLPFFDVFDNGTPGLEVPGWTGGFVKPKYVDPTAISGQNFSVKPPSPQGGNVLSTWDSTGGGNAVTLTTAPIADVVVESWVWFEPTMTPFNPAPYTPAVPAVQLNNFNLYDGEWWALGVRGTCSGNANPPDVGGYFANISGGVGTRLHFNTGICWAHFRTVNFSRLYLIDLNNGQGNTPGDYTILAGPIDILPGVNDGWQRVRLMVQGGRVQGNFGGTFGCDDGVRASATTTTTGAGDIYIAYREAILFNNNGTAGCRPPLFDQLDVHLPTTGLNFVGTGSPTTVGPLSIGVNSLPALGNLTWSITASGLAPIGAPNYSAAFLVLGFSTLPGGFPVAGAPPTVLGYIAPAAATILGFPSATGELSFTLPLPCVAAYEGITLASQVISIDPALPFPLPIGTTRAMEATIGR